MSYALYDSPAKFGMEPVGEVEWSDGSYQFDLTVVWRRVCDGALFWSEDSGCSCPSPFESIGTDDLVALTSLATFQQHLDQRLAAREDYDSDRSSAVAELLERLHQAGAR